MALILVLFGHPLADEPAWESRVLKVVVTRTDGSRELGSAVLIAGARMVANCHVLRDASRIEVEHAGARRQAWPDQRDAYRDLCFLNVPGYQADPVPMIDLGRTRVGLNVMAVGYSGGARRQRRQDHRPANL